MKKYRLLLLSALLFSSCESFVEIAPPKTESVSSVVYADDVGATAAIRGIYHELVRSGFASGQGSSITFLSGSSSDEFISYTSSIDEFYNNNILVSSGMNSSLWSSLYKAIYYCNSALEGLQSSSTVSVTVKAQLMGEAKFLRAFCHFYLMSLYGSVPLVTTTDYKVNAVAKRNVKQEITDQVIQDLQEAASLMATDFQFTNSERVRACSWAATALLARVYVYNSDWVNAETYASKVINQSGLFKLVTDPNGVFLKNSTESILQLMPVVPGQNTNEGIAFIPASITSLPTQVSITNSLISAFESGDKRKLNWTGSQAVNGNVIYYPLKYKVNKLNLPVSEYSMVLRLAEQYLIRSEARTMQGKFTEAMNDLDVIRTRAGLPSIQTKIISPTTDNMMAAIEQERRIELFSEWGHRWLDLKRWDRANAVLQSIKTNWSSNDMLYPLPQTEIASNPNLNPQNPGY